MGRAKKTSRLTPKAGPPAVELLDLGGLLRQTAVPLFLVNARRRLIFINHACSEVAGVTVDESVGQDCRYAEMGNPSLAARLAALCPPPGALAGQPEVTEALLLDQAGQRRWWKVSYWPIANADGSVAAVLGRIDPSESGGPTRQSEPLRQQMVRQREELHRRFGFDSLVAACPAMLRALEQATLAGRTMVSLCIIGAAGSGKEHLARAVHAQSELSNRPLVLLDAARLRVADVERWFIENNLEGQQGEPAAAYVHEPARLARDQQVRLLAAKVWLLAGTAGDPATQFAEGLLTSELYHRLTTLVIQLPPLKERASDIPLLAEQVIERCNAASAHQVTGLTPAALKLLLKHPWPGNLDEFQAVLAAAHTRSQNNQLDLADFPPVVRTAAELEEMPGPRPERALPLDSLLENAERRIIQLALSQARGNLSKAAAVLQISRPRLYRRMEQLRLLEDRLVLAAEPDAETDQSSAGATPSQ